MVACGVSSTVEFVGGNGVSRPALGKRGAANGDFLFPTTLALVPSVGLVVREYDGGRLQVFATPDAVAMAAMSPLRVGWMVGVARAALARARLWRDSR